MARTVIALAWVALLGMGPIFAQGVIRRFPAFPSAYVPARQIDVYLPQGYSATQRYPVIYMHDGQNVFNAENAFGGYAWEVDNVLDSLLRSNLVHPALVVAIWNTTNRWSEYLPEVCVNGPIDTAKPFPYARPEIYNAGVYSDDYLRFIVEELKPWIDKNFATDTSRHNTYVMGSSMGGLISAYAIAKYPDVFGGAACLSTHWLALDGACVTALGSILPIDDHHKYYFDYGNTNLDSLYEPFQRQVNEVLLSRGISEENFKVVSISGGDHTEASWHKRVWLPITFLLGTRD